MHTVLRRYQTLRLFTEQEAWTLFKLAAIAEAIGWTLLITGVYLRDFVLHGNGIPVTIAGQIHGMLFFGYIVAVFAVAPSLGWGWFRTLVAAACSVPPYGSLVYEIISAHYRKQGQLQQLGLTAGYHLLITASVS